ncbi:MAG: hypothetical protein OXP68_01375 [Anaerolineaceae bacterium]|nr:hypothetical protein [Anaerolineaceae bacterium]MDE0328695.1 hypothetical protein [Anaerolineaceae bacterium]
MKARQKSMITGGVFLIGMAALAYNGLWWPGTLVVLGISAIVHGLLTGKTWQTIIGGLWLIATAAVFYLRLPWWILLALTGLALIVGGLDVFRRSPAWKRKRKNDDDMDTQPGEPRAA